MKRKLSATFEAPPALVRDVGAWVARVYSGHVLAQTERRLATSSGALVRRMLDAELKRAAEAERDLERVVAKLRPNESWTYVVPQLTPGGKVRRVGIRRDSFPTEEEFKRDRKPGWNAYQVNARYEVGEGSSKVDYQTGPLLLEKALTVLRGYFDRVVVQRIEAAGDLVRKERGDEDLVELNLLRAECLKHTSVPKQVAAAASRKFDYDATGWKYLTEAERKTPMVKKFTAILNFKPMVRSTGSWDEYAGELRIDARPLDPTTVEEFREGLRETLRTARHELQHVGQTILTFLRKAPAAGERGEHTDPLQRNKVPHALRAEEFHTDLQDSLDTFFEKVRQVPMGERRWFLACWLGLKGKRPVGGATSWTEAHWFFRDLKEKLPQRYKDAVRIFMAELARQKFVIPPEEDVTSHITPGKVSPWGLCFVEYLQKRTSEERTKAGIKGRDKEFDEKAFPAVREEYRSFVDGLSVSQLLKHKDAVERGNYGREYYVTARWDATETGDPAEPRRDAKGMTIVEPHPKLRGRAGRIRIVAARHPG